jgi:hypothetical protein
MVRMRPDGSAPLVSRLYTDRFELWRLVATATAGARPTQYQFWRRDADGWHLARDYAAANTYTWTPAPSDIGAHALQVWVRSAGFAASYQAWQSSGLFIIGP